MPYPANMRKNGRAGTWNRGDSAYQLLAISSRYGTQENRKYKFFLNLFLFVQNIKSYKTKKT
jgi:hypothetical protein